MDVLVAGAGSILMFRRGALAKRYRVSRRTVSVGHSKAEMDCRTSPIESRRMGVLYDYFRATGDAAAVRLIEELDGGPVVRGDRDVAADAVDLKGIEPVVTLGQLVGFARGTAWTVDTVQGRLLWSADEQGPWLESIDASTRDTLASISDEQMSELAARWGRIEELSLGEDVADDEMPPVIEQIAGLARRARDAGEHLYCWACL